MNSAAIVARAHELFRANLRGVQVTTNRLFFSLLILQWCAAIILALTVSPYAWSGKNRILHLHVELAIFGGAVLNLLPLVLIKLKSESTLTRQVIAVTQMLWAALFVHLTGGRIETHFFIFGSLAFLAFYRDPWVLLTATAVVALDHLVIGFYWPESVYGIANPEWWRFLEHAGWVLFEVSVLILGCRRTLEEMHRLSDREATLEAAKADVEGQVTLRTEELRTSSDRYRTLIENTSAVPWEIDRRSCEIIYLAPQAKTLLAPTFDHSPGAKLSLAALFSPDDHESFREFIDQGGEDAEERHNHIDTRLITAERQVRHVRSFVAHRDADQDRSVYGISIDITRQKELEMELLQAQKMESIGQLAAGIAHEINTPTQFISDNLQFLQESMGDVFSTIDRISALRTQYANSAIPEPDISAVLGSIDLNYFREEFPKAIVQSLAGTARISAIVGAMKEFSHPALDKTPIDLNRAISSTITVASNEWKYVSELKTDFADDVPQVPVIPGAFNQVILNLVVNAAHAIAENLGERQTKGIITISTRRTGHWAEIRIADTGCGISEKDKTRIFDPFFTTKVVGKGTGQGLAIAHDVIVNKHGGSIEVEHSEVLGGTTFLIRLPLQSSSKETAAAAA